MEEVLDNLILLKRHLNSIEHMIYVSCKFTRTTEMIIRVLENIIQGYEYFFDIAYDIFVGEDVKGMTKQNKISLLSESLSKRNIYIDLSDYFLIKKLLLSDFESVGQYRKNLSLVSFVDGYEIIVNLTKLLEFYENLKMSCKILEEFN